MLRHALRPTLALALLAGCSSDPADENGDGVADGVLTPNNVSVIAPTRPRGFVAGRVEDGISGAPLAGAKVVLFGGGLTGELTTDGTGAFQFGPIAAGARFSLAITANGRTSALLTQRMIEDDAGNFPTDNGALWVGPIGLLPTDGRFSVQVVSELGAPVSGAALALETAVAYFEDGTARGSVVALATTNADGIASFADLPNVWRLSPRRESHAALVITVAPVDLDGDMRPDLRGATLSLSGADVRSAARAPIVVLTAPDGDEPLRIIASNVPALAGAPRDAFPAVLEATAPIRVVFNLPVDRDTFVATLTDETGDNRIQTSVVVSQLGNVVEINHDTSFQVGQEQNIAIRAQSRLSVPVSSVERAAPFFAKGDPAAPFRAVGAFVDANRDNLWGNDQDRLELRLDTPIGRPNATPAFVAELWLELDINGSGTVGDGPGELPPLGGVYPQPWTLNADEPSPANGAGRSGFTRFLSARTVSIPNPLTQLQGPVAFEVRFSAGRNGGPITDPIGRPPPERIEGSAQLSQP